MSDTRLYGLPSPTPSQFNTAAEKIAGKGALVWTDTNGDQKLDASELSGSNAALYVAQKTFTPGFEKLYRDLVEQVRQTLVAAELQRTYRVPITTDLAAALRAMPKSLGITDAEIAFYQRGTAKLLEVAPYIQTAFELQAGFTPKMRDALKTEDDKELVARYGFPRCIGNDSELCTSLSTFETPKSGVLQDGIGCEKPAQSLTAVYNPFSKTVRENGKLKNIPYATVFANQLKPAAAKLREAAAIFTKIPREKIFAKYLNQLADDFGNTDPFPYVKSDAIWNAQKKSGSIFFARIGPDENGNLGITADPCEAKAKFHFMIGLINSAFIKTAEALQPRYQDMENAYAALIGNKDLYAAQKAVVHSPDLIDVIYANGDDRGGSTGSSAAQTLPNWCGVDGNQDPCERRSMIFGNKTTLSYSPEIMQKYVYPLFSTSARYLFDRKLGFEMMGLHELHHNFGPQPGKLKPGSQVDYQSPLGKWGNTIEEFKAQLGALIFPTSEYAAAVEAHKTGKLTDTQFKDAEEYYNALVASDMSWGLRHIARSTAGGKFNGGTAYSKLSFAMIGLFVKNGALEFDSATKTWIPHPEKFPAAIQNMGETILRDYAEGDFKKFDDFMNYWIKGDGFNLLHIDRLQEVAGAMPSAQFIYTVEGLAAAKPAKKATKHR